MASLEPSATIGLLIDIDSETKNGNATARNDSMVRNMIDISTMLIDLSAL